MPDPKKVDYWYSESDFRLSNVELLALASLLKDASSYPHPFLYNKEESDRLLSKISRYFVDCGLNGIPENLEIY